jgi:hypothetical protein
MASDLTVLQDMQLSWRLWKGAAEGVIGHRR